MCVSLTLVSLMGVLSIHPTSRTGATSWFSKRTENTFQGIPVRNIDPDRWADMEEKARVFDANEHTWPQNKRFEGWPPKYVGEHSKEYIKTRLQLEKYYRDLPAGTHHKLDDMEGLTQTMILPHFAKEGFKVIDAPKELWQKLRDHYNKMKKKAPFETFPNNNLHKMDAHIPRVINDEHQHELNRLVTQALKPICEEWAGVELVPTSTYGVRVYVNGSTLFMHSDTPETHVVSAIFHIDHDLDEQWPLEIEDHDGRIHALKLEPGQVALYESATQLHSRLTPMRGRDYGSVFVHYAPVGWNWTRDDIVGATTPDNFEIGPKEGLTDIGLPPFEVYRRKYYKDRGLPLLDFAGGDLLALPVQNAAMMTATIPHEDL